MLHLTAALARKMNKKIHVLFIDWEAQFSCTIAYIESLREYYADVIEHVFIGRVPLNHKIPFTATSRVAVLAAGADWSTTTARRCDYRPAFSLYQHGMTFERFSFAIFADWFRNPAAMLVGIRSDEDPITDCRYRAAFAAALCRRQATDHVSP